MNSLGLWSRNFAPSRGKSGFYVLIWYLALGGSLCFASDNSSNFDHSLPIYNFTLSDSQKTAEVTLFPLMVKQPNDFTKRYKKLNFLFKNDDGTTRTCPAILVDKFARKTTGCCGDISERFVIGGYKLSRQCQDWLKSGKQGILFLPNYTFEQLQWKFERLSAKKSDDFNRLYQRLRLSEFLLPRVALNSGMHDFTSFRWVRDKSNQDKFFSRIIKGKLGDQDLSFSMETNSDLYDLKQCLHFGAPDFEYLKCTPNISQGAKPTCSPVLHRYYERSSGLAYASQHYPCADDHSTSSDLVATLTRPNETKAGSYVYYFVLEDRRVLRGGDFGFSIAARPESRNYGECDCGE